MEGQMAGHVYVVHGMLEQVRHDYAVVPTARDFHLRAHWKLVLSGRHGHEPAGWREQNLPYAKSRRTDRVWFISVSDLGPDRVLGLARRTGDLVREIARRGAQSRIGRA